MSTQGKTRLDRGHVRDLLTAMMRVRMFEDACAELYTQEKIRGFLHLYDGEEAIAAGVIPLLAEGDRVVATYREHGHALVRGVSMDAVMAEMFGKAEGCSGGRGGSMHLYDAGTNFYGGNAIVGGGLPLAAGLALADHMRGDPHVTRLFLWRGGGGRRRVSRGDEPGRPVGACRCCLSVKTTAMPWALRWGAASRPRPISAPRRPPMGWRPRWWTGWMWWRLKPRRGGPWQRSARPASRCSWSAAPTGSGRIRCSTPSSTGTRRKWRTGASAARSCVSAPGCWRPG